jgi:hypothetical protein
MDADTIKLLSQDPHHQNTDVQMNMFVDQILDAVYAHDDAVVFKTLDKLSKLPKGKAIDPKRAAEFDKQAFADYKSGKRMSALENAQAAYSNDPTSFSVLFNLARCEDIIGLSTEAREHLKESLVVEPRHPQAWD